MENMIDETGKFDFNLLRDFAKKSEIDAFLSEVPRAVLVGSSLFRGWFDKDEFKKKSAIKETVMFLQSPEQKNQEAKLKLLEKHIYPLFRTEHFEKKNNFILKVGRSSKNDIVLLDKSISSKHAEFHITVGDKKKPTYSIKDYGSSNFTIVNGKRLEPFWEKELKYGDVIRFGRFSLVLIKPKDLYSKL